MKALLTLSALCLVSSNVAMANDGPRFLCNSFDYRVIVRALPQAGYGEMLKTDGRPSYSFNCQYAPQSSSGGVAPLVLCTTPDARTIIINNDMSGVYFGSVKSEPLYCRVAGSSLD